MYQYTITLKGAGEVLAKRYSLSMPQLELYMNIRGAYGLLKYHHTADKLIALSKSCRLSTINALVRKELIDSFFYHDDVVYRPLYREGKLPLPSNRGVTREGK